MPQSWAAIGVFVIALTWTAIVVGAVVRSALRAPGRAVRVSVRMVPWPRIDVEVRGGPAAGSADVGERVDRADGVAQQVGQGAGGRFGKAVQ